MSISSKLAVTALLASLALSLAPSSRSANVTPPAVGGKLPGDVAPNAQAAAFDDFSWASFLAINAPADGTSLGQGHDATTLWETTWMSDFQVLETSGKPPVWGSPPIYQQGCKGASYPPPRGTRNLVWFTKGAGQEHSVTPKNGPLFDQNGNPVLFEILVNRPMYDFILSNKLYTISGQKAYVPPDGKSLAFPQSSTALPDAGAVMIKAAWKELTPKDDASQFHTAMAVIKDPDPGIKCRMATMGLVGLHITRKTVNNPKWIWSTFEHQANAPTLGDMPKGSYNFNAGRRKLAASEANIPPDGSWSLSSAARKPVEVVRFIPVTKTALAANAQYVAALKSTPGNSVFANYMLVGTQHATDNNDPSSESGYPSPQFLANTTMETYIQGDTQGTPAPNVTSSCGQCHAGANRAGGGRSDFSYILQRVTAK